MPDNAALAAVNAFPGGVYAEILIVPRQFLDPDVEDNKELDDPRLGLTFPLANDTHAVLAVYACSARKSFQRGDKAGQIILNVASQVMPLSTKSLWLMPSV